eukprot:m.24064 g.24064  ORF g.24064 m.24064 type:complete len:689 (-) comp7574_c0_seq1:69-2135(-)
MMRKKRAGSLIVEDKTTDYSGGNPENEVFDVLYLGERAVQSHTGVDVVNDVVSQLEDYELIGKSSKMKSSTMKDLQTDNGCALVLNPQHIVIIHKARKEVLCKDSVGTVTFFTLIPSNSSKTDYETIAYITRNIRLNVMRCHVFTVHVGVGQTIGDKMAKSQKEYAKIAEETLGDPFYAPKTAPREVPTGNLFNMQIHRGDLKALEVIGAGQFGAVYLATQRMRKCPYAGCPMLKAIDGHLKRHMADCKYKTASDPGPIEYETVTRAVKMLKGAATREAKQEFFAEANTMLMFDHPNVTNIMGVAVQQAPWLYVLEYCMYGDLRGVLKGCEQKRLKLNDAEFVHVCLGLACGMEHIAALKLVHMDLAARNLLLAEGNLVKVADFGLTRMLAPGADFAIVREKNIKLAIKWMSVEVLEKRKFSESSDLWSAAITMWEILSYGALPYAGKNNAETTKYVIEGKRLARPAGCPDILWKLIQKSWDQVPEKRGSFSDLRQSLEKATSSYKSEKLRDLGGMLTDPAVEKAARELQAQRDAERKQKAIEEKKRRELLAAKIHEKRHLWYHPNIPKKLCDKQVSISGPGSYLVREERDKSKLLLVINDDGAVSTYQIKVEPSSSRAGKFKYIFGGKPHTTIENILAVLSVASFRGKSGKPLKLGNPAPVPLKNKTMEQAPTQVVPKSTSNPLFQD